MTRFHSTDFPRFVIITEKPLKNIKEFIGESFSPLHSVRKNGHLLFSVWSYSMIWHIEILY